MLTGNKGEWSEPYVLLKLLADGKLHIGDENFEKVQDVFYPIIQVLRHEKDRNVNFSFSDNVVVITDGFQHFNIPINIFVTNAKLCFEKIKSSPKGNGSFDIPEIETFLKSFSINSLKAKSKLKNDITIQIVDSNSFLAPTLGFSIKSQLGRPSTLVNASNVTNFTYTLTGKVLSQPEIDEIHSTKYFSDKINLIVKYGANLDFEKVEHPIFATNLQTIDYNFDKILSEVILQFYTNNISSNNSVAKFIEKITLQNPVKYRLDINPHMYEMIMKKFLVDYALGMRASEIWTRNYQATGGYLVVRNDGELVSYHFYFAKSFEDFLFNNTKLETPDMDKHGFGIIYTDKGVQKIKLNLQIRFTK